MNTNRRGGPGELSSRHGHELTVMEPWPSREISVGPDSQTLMRGARPRNHGMTPTGTNVVGGGGGSAPTMLDAPHPGWRGAGSGPRMLGADEGFPKPRHMRVELGREPHSRAGVARPNADRRAGVRRAESGSDDRSPAHGIHRIIRLPGASQRDAVREWITCPHRTAREIQRFVNLLRATASAVPSVAPLATYADSLVRCTPQGCSVRAESGYWTDLTWEGEALDMDDDDWTEIGGGASMGRRMAQAAVGDLTAPGAMPAPAPTAPGTAPARSLSSDTLDQLNVLNTVLRSLPTPDAVAPLILIGLASGRYQGQRAFYHSKDYGEHWGKAMGVLWLANNMTGNEPVVRNMVSEARDRLRDAQSKLRDITG